MYEEFSSGLRKGDSRWRIGILPGVPGDEDPGGRHDRQLHRRHQAYDRGGFFSSQNRRISNFSFISRLDMPAVLDERPRDDGPWLAQLLDWAFALSSKFDELDEEDKEDEEVVMASA